MVDATTDIPAPGEYIICDKGETSVVEVIGVKRVPIGLKAHAGDAETRVRWRHKGGAFRFSMSLEAWRHLQPSKVDPSKVDPSKVDPSKVDPSKVDLSKVTT